MQVVSGEWECSEAARVLGAYFGVRATGSGSGAFAPVEDWSCGSNSFGGLARGESVVASCERPGGDRIVALVSGGSGSASGGSTEPAQEPEPGPEPEPAPDPGTLAPGLDPARCAQTGDWLRLIGAGEHPAVEMSRGPGANRSW